MAALKEFIYDTLEPAADASDQQFNISLMGSYLYQYEIKTSADDIVTFTVKSAEGSTLFAVTTSGATSGEIGFFDDFWALTGRPTWTLSGLGSGTIKIIITCTRSPEPV